MATVKAFKATDFDDLCADGLLQPGIYQVGERDGTTTFGWSDGVDVLWYGTLTELLEDVGV